MNIRNSASITLWFAVIFSTNIMAGDIAIYRWIDENNVVNFSQHQPLRGNYSQLTTIASYKARDQRLEKKSNLLSVEEQLSQYKQEAAEVLIKNKEIADKNCKSAQLNEKTLNSFEVVMITDAEGKSKALSNKEKKSQLALSKKHIDMYCDKKK